jgi:hypothetical protein
MKMRSLIAFSLVVFLLIIPSALDAQFAEQHRTAHNALYGELLGKGVLYGFFYERLITERLGAGIGFSTWSVDLGFINAESVTLIPIYLSWYPIGDEDRLYVDAGMDFGSATVGVRLFGEARAEGSGTIGCVGFGFCRHTKDGGIMLKLGPMLFFGKGETRVWGNLSVGVTF